MVNDISVDRRNTIYISMVMVVLYFLAYSIWDSSDIEYQSYRLSDVYDDNNPYYTALNYMLPTKFTDDFIYLFEKLTINESYSRFGFASQYFGSFELYRVVFFILNIPFLVIFLYYCNKLAELLSVNLDINSFFVVPGGILIFYAPTLDAPLAAISAVCIYYVTRGFYIYSLIGAISYFIIFDDKGVIALLMYLFAYIVVCGCNIKLSLAILLSLPLYVLPSGTSFTSNLLTSVSSSTGMYSHYSSLVESTIGFGKYPLVAMVASLVSTTSLTFTNYLLLFFYCVYFWQCKCFFKKNEGLSRFVSSAVISFSILTWALPSIASVRQHSYIFIVFVLYASLMPRIYLYNLVLLSVFSLMTFFGYKVIY